ncbi:hypothetical protein Pint_12319 [Pistacia integerrima]|uniref:Uncharacterized protein n=1 Tax=Pistacia integerrima TaxID=434235 RepID=A0ACC0XKX6_9ROSI|nr:hypothetical protein Pint_12319 [Pistacia integerrima]
MCFLVVKAVVENTSDMIETLYSAWGRSWVKEREKQRRNNKVNGGFIEEEGERVEEKSTWRSWMRDLTRSLKDLVLRSKDNEGYNILHLAARLPPSNSPNIKSLEFLPKLRGVSCGSSFLSVFHCRYVEEDFLLLLPHNMAVGSDTLALSVAAMMVVFSATMFIIFKDGMLCVPTLVTIMASLPVYKFMRKFLTTSFLFKSLHEEGSFE